MSDNLQKRKRDSVLNMFKFCEEEKVQECLINNCKKKLKSASYFNLKRHIQIMHKETAVELGIDENNDLLIHKKKKKETQLIIDMDKQTFIKACVKLTTIHALPFSSLEYEGMEDIINPIKKSLNLTMNSNKVLTYIDNAAIEIKNYIKKEIKNKFICLKIDSATKFGRNILGINLQYLHGKYFSTRLTNFFN